MEAYPPQSGFSDPRPSHEGTQEARSEACPQGSTVHEDATAYDIKVELLQGTANRPHLSIANWSMIDTDNGSDLRTSATQENLICYIEFSTINLSFAGNAAKLAPCQFYNRIARNA